MSTPTVAPSKFRAGEEVKWTIDPGDDYRPVDGSSLVYQFANTAGVFSVTATDNGDGLFLITITPTVSATLLPGDYTYAGLTTKGTSTIECDSGTVTILAALNAAVDGRTHAKQMLDLFKAAMLAKAQNRPDVAGYTLAGRSLSSWSWKELREESNYWAQQYQRETNAQRIEKGLGTTGKVRVRFS